MDVLFFFKERLRFIRYYFETTDTPFRETIHKIEALEHPYEAPVYDESGEPPYLEEWQRATEARDVLGRSCLSMLSASLQLYFRAWETELRVKWETGERDKAFKGGMIDGYRIMFGELFELDWAKCPADMAIVEQITLARNRDQHPDNFFSVRVTHSAKDREKYPYPFFMNENERRFRMDPDNDGMFFFAPEITVSSEALFTAIEHVERLADWLESEILAVRYGRRTV